MDCTGLEADILNSCANKPKGGLEANAVIIRKTDIDLVTTTIDVSNKLLVTSLACVSGATGFLVESIKQLQGVNWELIVKPTSVDKFKQSFLGVLMNPTAANKLSLDGLLDGTPYVVVVEKLWKGTASADAFEVLGLDSGLYPATAVGNSQENDGIISFSLASADGYEEDTMPKTLLDTDYATTKIAFTNKFATA